MSEETRSLEQIYRSAVKGLYARLRSNYYYLYRTLGDDGIDMIEKMSREFGESVLEIARKSLDTTDIRSVTDYLLKIFENVSWGKDTVHLVERTPTRVVIRVDECPLKFDKPEICRAHTTMERTVVEGLNADLDYRIGKSIPAGDAFCEHILEIRP